MRKVSIIMGIYNCERTLDESLQSIINQSFSDWELILCDDGSTDATYAIAERYTEQHPGKIKLIENETNLGLNITLNKCLSLAEGDYIARQDGDDVSLLTRLEKEVAFLDYHPDYSIVSTPNIRFDDYGDWGVSSLVTEPNERDLIRGPTFAHAACMIRKEALDTVGGYSVSPWLLRVEDYHLWYKLALKGYRGMNLTEPLYRCRDDRNAQSRRRFSYRINESYVKWLVFTKLKLPIWFCFYIIKPILVGLMPKAIYSVFHRRKFGKQ